MPVVPAESNGAGGVALHGKGGRRSRRHQYNEYEKEQWRIRGSQAWFDTVMQVPRAGDLRNFEDARAYNPSHQAVSGDAYTAAQASSYQAAYDAAYWQWAWGIAHQQATAQWQWQWSASVTTANSGYYDNGLPKTTTHQHAIAPSAADVAAQIPPGYGPPTFISPPPPKPRAGSYAAQRHGRRVDYIPSHERYDISSMLGVPDPSADIARVQNYTMQM